MMEQWSCREHGIVEPNEAAAQKPLGKPFTLRTCPNCGDNLHRYTERRGVPLMDPRKIVRVRRDPSNLGS